MPLRMSARLLASAGALALAASLSSCGFNYATDRVYDVAGGTTNRSETVDVLSAVIVSAQPGSGTLITAFANKDESTPIKVTDIAGVGQTGLQVVGFKPITVAPGGAVNLASTGGIVVKSAHLGAGRFLTLKFTFNNGKSEDVDIPVVWACNEYAGYDRSASGSSGSASPSSSAPSASASSSASSSSSASAGSASSSSSSSPSQSPSPTETSQPPVSTPSSVGSNTATPTQCAIPSSSAFPETGSAE